MKISDAGHAFITGGASGIGLGIADALARHGVAVTIADINRDNLDSALSERDEKFRGALLDTRDREGWALARAQAEAAFGPVEILVNNAGIAPDGLELADMPPENFDRVIAINLTGVFNGVSAFGRSFREARRGHIVNTASMSGMVMDGPGIGSYGPSKAGVIAMSEVLRMEMEPYGVGVSVLCPSYVATDLMANTLKAGGSLRDPSVSLLGAEMKPAQVGDLFLRGIEENRPFIYTHPERLAAVEKRFAGIMAGYGAA